VAECFVNNESLSSFLVKNGYAFAYKRYSKQFVEDENFAKKNKLGLWAMKFQYPWDYRRKK
jgi:endonuclease YncB( thermonuclease family)